MWYRFKVLPELGWAVFVGVAVAVGTELITVNQATLDNPAALIAAMVAGSARAVGGAILAVLKPSGD